MNLKSIFFNFFFLRKKFILCIPHINCRNDKYDLINYTGDNVLSYLHELNTQNTKLHDFKYFLVCYDKSRLGLINDYVAKNFKKIDLKLLFVDLDNHKFSIKNFKHKLFFLYIWLQSKFILTSAPYRMLIPTKLFGQKIFCLSYFTPFKNDYFPIDNSGFKNFNLDVCFTTSKLASQITSISEGVNFNKFEVTGFPRNDRMLSPRYSKSEIFNELGIDYNDKLLIYVPTHRDYKKNKKVNVFGFSNALNKKISQLLKDNNCKILIKFHPNEVDLVIHNSLAHHLILYKPTFSYTLYDIMPHSELLITDYSSIYFDYLLTEGQVIFNLYDFDKYLKTRSLSYDPIESFLNGEICKNEEEFMSGLNKFLNGIVITKTNIKLDKIFNKFNDGLSSTRITNHIESEISLKRYN